MVGSANTRAADPVEKPYPKSLHHGKGELQALQSGLLGGFMRLRHVSTRVRLLAAALALGPISVAAAGRRGLDPHARAPR